MHGGILCCCRSSPTRMHVSFGQRWPAILLGCNYLRLLLPFYHCKRFWPFNRDLWHQQGILQLIGHIFFFFFLAPFTVNFEMAVHENLSRSASSEILRLSPLAPTTLSRSKSLKIPINIFMLGLNFCR